MRSGLALVALLVGCGGEPIPGTASVTLGTSAPDGSGFFELSGDQPLIPGAQGGFHIWIKYRMTGMPAGKCKLRRTARRVSDGRLVLQSEHAETVGEPGREGYWEVPYAVPSFMCPTPIGVNVIGERIGFDIEVSATDGTRLADARAEATPYCPSDAQGEFCQRICSGN